MLNVIPEVEDIGVGGQVQGSANLHTIILGPGVLVEVAQVQGRRSVHISCIARRQVPGNRDDRAVAAGILVYGTRGQGAGTPVEARRARDIACVPHVDIVYVQGPAIQIVIMGTVRDRSVAPHVELTRNKDITRVMVDRSVTRRIVDIPVIPGKVHAVIHLYEAAIHDQVTRSALTDLKITATAI